MRDFRARDLSPRGGGRSTFQAASPYYSLHGIPLGQEHVEGGGVDEYSPPRAQPGRVAFGAFTANEAAVGLIIATLLMLYLGSRVVVDVKVPKK